MTYKDVQTLPTAVRIDAVLLGGMYVVERDDSPILWAWCGVVADAKLNIDCRDTVSRRHVYPAKPLTLDNKAQTPHDNKQQISPGKLEPCAYLQAIRACSYVEKSGRRR